MIDEAFVDVDIVAAEGEHAERRAVRAEERAAHAEERLRSRILHAGHLEHRLKTSLAVITGWSWSLESMWERLSEDERRLAVQTIRRRAEAAVADAEQLLRDVQAELTGLDLEPVAIDLRDALELSAHTYGGTSVGHEVRYRGPRSVPVAVDPAALQQVLGQLLENAIKYSPAGGTVTLSAHSGDGSVVVEVIDEGQGLPEGVDIFAPFERGPVRVDQPGTGLGLYIVRNLVSTMGGTIEARSNEHGGTTFTLTLPA